MNTQQTFLKELDHTTDIGEVIKTEAENNIVLYVKNVPVDVDPENLYSQLAEKIGYVPNVDEDPVTAKLSGNSWTDVRFNKAKKTEAYKYSDLRHALHTDYCYIPHSFIDCEWSFLFCIDPAPIGGATIAMNPYVLIDILKKHEPGRYRELTETDVIFERQGAPFGANTTRIIDFDEVGPLFFWSVNRVSESNTSQTKELCKWFHEFLETRIIGGGLATAIDLKRGEALFFQDKRSLHGRNAFFGERHLKKGLIIRHDIEKAKEAMAKMVSGG